MPIHKVKGAILIYDLLCDDGNYGMHKGNLIKLYLYLSRLEWELRYHDEAFRSLDEALRHAKALEMLCDGKEHSYTAPLVSHVTFLTESDCKIAHTLPDDWSFWCNPNYEKVEQEIKADPRWEKWVKQCQNK